MCACHVNSHILSKLRELTSSIGHKLHPPELRASYTASSCLQTTTDHSCELRLRLVFIAGPSAHGSDRHRTRASLALDVDVLLGRHGILPTSPPPARFTLYASGLRCSIGPRLPLAERSGPGGIRAAISRRPRRQALTSTFGGAPQPAQRSSPMADLCTLLRSSFRGAYS